MQALLGKIIEVESCETYFKITFEPLCTLPDYKAPPEHLKGQKLTIDRQFSKDGEREEASLLFQAYTTDARELGNPGDSIVLTVDESLKFLRPMMCANESLLLFWWKDDTPPNWTAKANGITRTGKWTRDESRSSWGAKLSGADFGLPNGARFSLAATCGSVKAHHAYREQFSKANTVQKFDTNQGTDFYLRNCFLSLGVTSCSGGALQRLPITGMPSLSDYKLIRHPLDWEGHVDRFRTGWSEWNTMRDKTLDCAGATRENGASRVTMEGEIEDDLRTSFSATLLDDWPLLVMRRDFFLHEKKDDKKDELKQPIDKMRLFQTGFRCAVGTNSTSRIWCCENGEALSFRLAREHEGEVFWHWTMEGGWALIEHCSYAYMLYFFDAQAPPHLGLWRGPHTMTLEPFWAGVPLKPGDSTGFTLGLAAGSLGGASENGAWIACQSVQNNERKFALIGRFRHPARKAKFRCGDDEIQAPLNAMMLPGIGTIYVAETRMPCVISDDKFTVALAGEGEA